MNDMFYRHKITDRSYLADESKMTGAADDIIFPMDENELRGALIYLNNRSIPTTISAMRTGVCGGAVPKGGDIISLTNLTGITGVGRDDRGFYIRVLPCTTLDDIDFQLSIGLHDDVAELTPGALSELRSSEHRYFYPVDPTEMGGSIGGNIATNASGPRTFRYGPTREWVKSLKVMFADGTYTWIERGSVHAVDGRISFFAGRNYYSFQLPDYTFNDGVKNSAGPRISPDMDLIDLFIGSEGIFAVITEAEVRLVPRHPLMSSIAFLPDDDSALAAARDLKSSDLDLEFIEYMDGASLDLLRQVASEDPVFLKIPPIPAKAGSALFFDMPLQDYSGSFDELSGILSSHGCEPEDIWCGHEADDRRRMREMRHSIPRTIFEYVASLKEEMPKIHKMGTDMSVPDDRADEMMAFYRDSLEAAGLEYVMFGHIANNHPHVEIILKSMDDFEKAQRVYEEFARKAVELGGSPSAEHGIGKIKTSYMEMLYGKKGVESLRRIKSILDPNWILCPGNLVGGRP